MKILFLDIETAPNEVYTWGLYNQFISPSQVKKGQYVLCWSAKWLDEDKITFDSIYKSSVKDMLLHIHKLLDRADVVVHQNGKSFDIPMLNTEFVKHGILPTSPYKQVDLKKTSQRVFRFPTSKLEYVAKALKIGEKLKDDVKFELWLECMAMKEEAWIKMEKYNIQDTLLAEKLYMKYRPWITNHPNYGSYGKDSEVCPHCGSKHLQKRGYRVVKLLKYPQYHCQDCGAWFRSNKALKRDKGMARYVGIPD